MIDLISKVPLTGWLVVVLGVVMVIFAALIAIQDVEKRSSKFFLLFALALASWGFAFVFFDIARSTPLVHSAIIVFYFIAGLVAPTLFFFLSVFSNEKSFNSFSKVITIFAPYLLISGAFAVPNLLVGYNEVVGGSGNIVFGKGFYVYILYSVVLVVFGFGVLARDYRASAGIFKFQIRAMLVVFVVSALATLAITLFLPVFTGTQNLFWVGYITATIFLLVTGSIIIKYNFWSFKVIATEFFIFVIFITLLVELFFATSVIDLLVKVAITLLVVFSSFFLMTSIRREIESKEKIEKLLRGLDDMHAQLKVLDKKKSEFLAIASHHLRDPLTTLKGYSSMLLEGSFGEISTSVREAVEKIFESSKRLITMISDFMDISNIETGDIQYKFTEVDMRKMVTDVVGDMRQNAEHVNLAFDLTVAGTDDEKYIVIADLGKIRQVLSNLIDNSIKYTPKGEVHVLLSKSSDKRKIIFSLSDTGIGMSELTKEKIFRKFSRADGVNKVYTEGTGLGLYVAYEIVKKHEGRIWAESKGEGHGSQFYVELEAKQ
jgi:signal transduction histidine kinase